MSEREKRGSSTHLITPSAPLVILLQLNSLRSKAAEMLNRLKEEEDGVWGGNERGSHLYSNPELIRQVSLFHGQSFPRALKETCSAAALLSWKWSQSPRALSPVQTEKTEVSSVIFCGLWRHIRYSTPNAPSEGSLVELVAVSCVDSAEKKDANHPLCKHCTYRQITGDKVCLWGQWNIARLQ